MEQKSLRIMPRKKYYFDNFEGYIAHFATPYSFTFTAIAFALLSSKVVQKNDTFSGSRTTFNSFCSNLTLLDDQVIHGRNPSFSSLLHPSV